MIWLKLENSPWINRENHRIKIVYGLTGLCSCLLASGLAMGKMLYWTAQHRFYNQWRSQIGMTMWHSFSVFILFLGRGQLASLIESLKFAEKNLTLVFHPTRRSGWNYSGFYTHHPAEMTQQETWAAMVGLHWHQMYILGYVLDKTLAPLLEPETLLDRKCPNVSIAICSTAPTFLLLTSWNNPALTQREICHFLHHPNSFLQQIGVPWRSPMKLLTQFDLA